MAVPGDLVSRAGRRTIGKDVLSHAKGPFRKFYLLKCMRPQAQFEHGLCVSGRGHNKLRVEQTAVSASAASQQVFPTGFRLYGETGSYLTQLP
jgi:hypothetical protein